jgi:alpha-glucosidase (family GH31 glycosyl hydrolase)
MRRALFAACLVVSCKSHEDAGKARVAEPACGGSAFAWAEAPIGFAVCEGGAPIVRTAKQAPFYVLSSSGDRIELGEPSVRTDGDATILESTTSDGRKATITLKPDGDGARRVRFEVAGKTRDERYGVALELAGDEGIYGLLELPVPGVDDASRKDQPQALDLRGLTVDMVVTPLIALFSPFVVSSKGHGVEVDSDWPGTWSIGSSDAPDVLRVEQEGPTLDLVIFPGPTPTDAVARYARSVGTTRVPPEWSLGPWRWRDQVWNLPNFYDGAPNPTPYDSMIVEDVLMSEALSIPTTVYLIDRPWGPGKFGFDDYAWSDVIVPEHQKMIDWLGTKNERLALWMAPWASGPAMNDAIAKGYVVKDERPFTEENARLLDLTNPAAIEWYQAHLAERVKDGVRAFKLDRGDEKPPDGLLKQGTYFDGRDYREVRNAYPALYAKAVAGAFAKGGAGEDWITIARAGWRGSTPYTGFWGGDALATEGGLRASIISVQRAAVLNFPIWGTDTCGYTGGPNGSGTADGEVCARWLAFSAFVPLMEVGPNGNAALWSRIPDGSKGSVGEGGYDYTPLYDEPLLAIWSLYAQLHVKLAPYLHAQIQKSHDDGTPIVRPMALAYPELRDRWEQYLLGPDVLVRPIWKKGTTSVEVALPAGVWIDAWTKSEVTGPKTLTVDTPLHRMPIYVKKGSTVDLGDLEALHAAAKEKVKTKPDLATLAASVK